MGFGYRPARGVRAGLAMLLVVAIPAGWCAFLSLVSFTGCLIDCTEPDPVRGTLWAVAAATLLSLPIATGLRAARVPVRRATPWFLGLAITVVAAGILAQRVI